MRNSSSDCTVKKPMALPGVADERNEEIGVDGANADAAMSGVRRVSVREVVRSVASRRSNPRFFHVCHKRVWMMRVKMRSEKNGRRKRERRMRGMVCSSPMRFCTKEERYSGVAARWRTWRKYSK